MTKDKHYLFKMRKYLLENGAQIDTIKKKIEEMKKGKKNTLKDHIKGMVYSLLSSQRKWEYLVPHVDKIDEIFFQYDVEKIMATDCLVFEESIKAIKCGNKQIKKQMNTLKENIKTLQKVEKEFGTIDDFLRSDKAYAIVKMLSRYDSPYKLKQMGEALVWEYVRNMGVDGAKPDVHIRRFLSSERMGRGNSDFSYIDEALADTEKLSKETGLLLSEVDAIIWNYCASSSYAVCEKMPKCEKCCVKDWCNYKKRSKND